MPKFNCTERSGVDCRSGAKRNVTAWARAKSKRMWDFVKRTLFFFEKLVVKYRYDLWIYSIFTICMRYELKTDFAVKEYILYIIYTTEQNCCYFVTIFINIIIYYITRDARDNRRNSNFSTKSSILLEFFKMGIKSSLFIIHTWLVVYSQGEKWFDKMVLVC